MAKSVETQIALIFKDVEYMKKKIDHIDKRMDDDYVSKAELETLRTEFKLVQKLVYGLAGVILLTVAGAIIRLVIG